MKRILGAGLLAGVAAALVVLSGVIPLASSGHWAVTSWLLDFAKRRSVATHAIGIPVPPLDDPTLVLQGAGHYEAGCRPCHGAPGGAPPAIPARMTPHPPNLQHQVSRWEPAELFYIVRYGIKFTGMPAWPAPTRDDEVWAVVAFLRRLPGLDGAAYERLVRGAPDPADSAAQAPTAAPPSPIERLVGDRCARCHGAGGRGRERPAFPRLAGQKAEYLRLALEGYARGARHSGTMTPIAQALDAAAMRSIADHYAGLAPAPPAATASASAERGALIAAQGIPTRRVPRCAECHGPAPSRRNAAYPRLSGQYAGYLSLQLRLFAEQRRGGSAYAHLMRDIAAGLSPAQMQDVAAYYASLPAAAPGQ